MKPISPHNNDLQLLLAFIVCAGYQDSQILHYLLIGSIMKSLTWFVYHS